MFRTLLESRAIVERRGRWTAASALLHAACISAAVTLTMPPLARTGERALDPPPLQYVAIRQREAEVARTDAAQYGERLNVLVEVVIPNVPRFDVASSFDPSPPAPSEIFREPGPLLPGGHRPIDVQRTHSASAVDRQVQPLPNNGTPRYPERLRAASVEGEVTARFIVDTTGTVEPSSIAILRTTHTLFADAIRNWLSGTRYVPAELEGRRVRQLVEQRFEFSVRR